MASDIYKTFHVSISDNIQGRLQDRTTGWWRGGGDRGRHSRHACPMTGSLTGRGLGVSPHFCVECLQ